MGYAEQNQLKTQLTFRDSKRQIQMWIVAVLGEWYFDTSNFVFFVSINVSWIRSWNFLRLYIKHECVSTNIFRIFEYVSSLQNDWLIDLTWNKILYKSPSP